MKKFAVSLIALAAISGAALAQGSQNHVPAFDHNPQAVGASQTVVDADALAVIGSDARSERPNYINGNQLR
jgi:hypothetical protein